MIGRPRPRAGPARCQWAWRVGGPLRPPVPCRGGPPTPLAGALLTSAGPTQGARARPARWPASRARWQSAGSQPAAAHWRTGGEEECARTGDTNPGCNYLVRGYSPSMPFFWRGDRLHFSSPLPFRRARAPSTSAGPSGAPARAVPRLSPDPRSVRSVRSVLPF